MLKMALAVRKNLREELNKDITVINALNVSDLDYDTLDSLKQDHQVIMTLEDGELQGGYGVNVASYFANSDIKVLNYGITKKFHTDFKAEELLTACGMSIPKLVNDVKNYL